MAALLVACGSTPGPAPAPHKGSAAKAVKTVPAPRGGGYYKDDGPGDEIPANLDDIPDAEPRWEPLHRWANRPRAIHGFYPPIAVYQAMLEKLTQASHSLQ